MFSALAGGVAIFTIMLTLHTVCSHITIHTLVPYSHEISLEGSLNSQRVHVQQCVIVVFVVGTRYTYTYVNVYF